MINTLFNEDCLLTMARMSDGLIDLTVTSPPYEDLRKYNGFSFEFEKVAKELYRVTKLGGVVVWVVGDKTKKGSESGNSFRQALYFMSCGFNLHDTMIYAKKNFIPQTNNRYEQAFEYMFVLSKGKPNTFNSQKVASKMAGKKIPLACKGYGFKEGAFRRRDEIMITSDFKIPGNIFYYATGGSKKNHPAVFPKKLATDHVLSWSNPGDLVFDPMFGSGTVMDVAIEIDRNYLGSEISTEYYNDYIASQPKITQCA